MTEILLLCILGVGIGGFYAILATGIVVGHKGSGLINLDQGVGYVSRIHICNYARNR